MAVQPFAPRCYVWIWMCGDEMVLVSYGIQRPRRCWAGKSEEHKRVDAMPGIPFYSTFQQQKTRHFVCVRHKSLSNRCLCILLYGPATYQLCAKVLMAVDGFAIGHSGDCGCCQHGTFLGRHISERVYSNYTEKLKLPPTLWLD